MSVLFRPTAAAPERAVPGSLPPGRPLRLVAVSGGLKRPSRTLALVDNLLRSLGHALPLDTDLIELGPLVPMIGPHTDRRGLPAPAEAALRTIEAADALLVASPIYRGTYTGHFKHLFDLVDQNALIDKPVLLAATGGSERHALAIDHQFRPLFSFFQAQTLPIGVYATDRDFTDYEVDNPALCDRITLAVERALPVLHAAMRTPERTTTVAAPSRAFAGSLSVSG